MAVRRQSSDRRRNAGRRLHAERRREAGLVAVEHREPPERRSGEERRGGGERRGRKSRTTAPFGSLSARERRPPTAPVWLAEERRTAARRRGEAIQQREAPLLQVRRRLLVVPIVGALNMERARAVIEDVLRGIRRHRARAVVMDVTGVPTLEPPVADYVVEAVEAARLLGAVVIVTGVSPQIAQRLTALDVTPARLTTALDLQAGIAEAERLLGSTGGGPAERIDAE